MASPPACTKCRSAGAAGGDSWCTGCLSLEASQSCLRGKWFSASHRRLAEEVLHQASRQVVALKDLDAGVRSLSDSFEGRLRGVARSKAAAVKQERSPTPAPRSSRTELGKERPRTPSGEPPRREKEEESEYEYSEEAESPRRVTAATTAAKSKAEPKADHTDEERREDRGRSRSRSLARKRRRRPNKRAGVRHQRRYRTLQIHTWDSIGPGTGTTCDLRDVRRLALSPSASFDGWMGHWGRLAMGFPRSPWWPRGRRGGAAPRGGRTRWTRWWRTGRCVRSRSTTGSCGLDYIFSLAPGGHTRKSWASHRVPVSGAWASRSGWKGGRLHRERRGQGRWDVGLHQAAWGRRQLGEDRRATGLLPEKAAVAPLHVRRVRGAEGSPCAGVHNLARRHVLPTLGRQEGHGEPQEGSGKTAEQPGGPEEARPVVGSGLAKLDHLPLLGGLHLPGMSPSHRRI